MTTTFIHRNLPRLLLQAREAVMAHTRPSLREHGLSDQQWRVLRVLGEHGAVETGRIAREAFILGPSLTGVLARMERDGLIRRQRDPADQRSTLVEATARGKRLVSRLSQTIEAHYAWLEQQLGRDRLTQLYTLLDDLIALEEPAGLAGGDPTEGTSPQGDGADVAQDDRDAMQAPPGKPARQARGRVTRTAGGRGPRTARGRDTNRKVAA